MSKHKAVFHTDYFLKPFNDNMVTLTIDNIKSTTPILARLDLECYKDDKTTLYTVKSTDTTVVDKVYRPIMKTVTFTDDQLEKTVWVKLAINLIGMTDRTDVKFNHLMLNNGIYTDYHPPNNKIEKSGIYFNNNFYCELYDKDDNSSWLQVIRPNYDNFTTDELTKSKCTVLAPHLANELEVDSAVNLGLEYMNMSEQYINILR